MSQFFKSLGRWSVWFQTSSPDDRTVDQAKIEAKRKSKRQSKRQTELGAPSERDRAVKRKSRFLELNVDGADSSADEDIVARRTRLRKTGRTARAIGSLRSAPRRSGDAGQGVGASASSSGTLSRATRRYTHHESGGTEHSLERVAELQQPMFILTPS